MAKETYLGANVEVTTDSFSGWINKTNQVRDDMGRIVVTVTTVADVEPNTTNAGVTTGNAAIAGVLTVNTMAVSADLRGGTVTVPSTLVVTSNVHFTESANVWITSNTNHVSIDSNNMVISSNVTFDGGSTKTIRVDVGNTTVNTGSVYINSNAEFAGVSANVNTTSLNVTANTTISGANVYITSTNTTIGDVGTDGLTVNAASDFNANVNIDGILTQTANAVFTGANVQIDSALTTIGNATTDLLVVNSYLNSDLIPNATTIDLGSDAKPYGNVHTTYVWSDNNIETQGNMIIKGSTTRTLKTLSTTTTQQALNVVLENSAAATFTPIVANTSGVHSGANTTYDLGSTTINWRNLYVKDAAIANSAVISNVLTVNTQANTASLMVRDLTATRVPYVGTAGEIVDSANLVFSGTGLNVIGTANITSSANVGGTFGVTGATTLASTLAVTGIATFSSNAVFSDSDYIVIGTGADLQIYHDGTDSYIKDAGTGNLKIDASQLDIQTSNSTATETMATFVRDGAVTLFHNNTARLATSGTGVSVTGVLAVSSNETVGGTLAVTGASTFANTVGATGAATFANTVGVTGAATLSNTLGVTGAATFANTIAVTGSASFSNNIIMGDNRTIIMGDSQDFMIYHDGSHSYVSDLGTGNLKLDASQLDIQTSNSTVTETMATFVRDGAVTLYYNNTARIATTSTGASVTGALAVSGNETVGGTLGVTGAATFANTIAVTGATTLSSTLGVSGTTTAAAINASGLVNVTNTTDATSTTAAALKTAGGLAVAKKLYVGDQTFATANVTISGTGNYITTPGANVTNNMQVGGTATIVNLTVTGTTTLNTDSQLSLNNAVTAHSTVTDDLTLTNATIIGGVTPDANNTYDIGSSTAIWKTLYANNVVANVAWASVTDKPDPVVTVTLTGDVAGSSSATLTDLANGTVTIATTVQQNSVALGTDTTGNYVGTLAFGTPGTATGNSTVSSGLTISATVGEGTAATIAHADTSSVANLSVDNSNGTVLQDIGLTFDTFGHVTGTSSASVNLDLRYPQVAFKTIAVSGQSSIVADGLTDTLNLVGAGITAITTNATSDTITITSTEVDTLHSVTTRDNTTTNSITVNDVNARNLILSGNLTVSGTTTYVNTTNLQVGDNIITLNADYAGSAPSENAGIEIERGTLANTSLLWNETSDRWTFTNNGSTFYNIPISTEYDNYQSWTIKDGDTTTYTITSGDTLQIVGGTYITSNFTADDVLTITHDNTTRTNTTTGNTSPGYGGTFTAVDSITTNTQGHVTAVNTKTVTIPASDNTNTTYNLLAVANTAANAGILRLDPSSGANDDVIFTGSGATTVSSNATNIIISSTDNNTTYDLLAVANTAANAGILRLKDSSNANDSVTFTGSGTVTISSNATHIIATGANTNLGYTTATTQGTVTSSTGTNAVIPAANSTVAGLVTTGSQTIAGTKTFSSTISGSITGDAGGNANTATYADDAGGLRVSSGGALIIDGTAQSTPVNYLQVRAANTAQDVLVTTAGTDTNIDLLIQTKGTGSITLDTGTGAGVIDLKPGSSNVRVWDDTSTQYFQIATGDLTANRTLTLPDANVTLVSGTMVPTTGTGATGTWDIGISGTAATATTLSGLTSTIAELNKLDGVTASTAELNKLDGVTATTTELNYVDGVTSNIQTQINTKAPTANPTFTGSVNAGNSIVLGSWTIWDSGGTLYFKYGANNVFSINSSGNLNAIGDITAYQTSPLT